MKVKVIMLPTYKATWPNCIWLGRRSGQLRLDTSYNDSPKSIDPIDNSMLPQHIYLIDESAEIKEGDWVYHPEVSQEYTIIKKGIKSKGLHPAQGVFEYKPTTNPWYDKCSKIIASTDPSIEIWREAHVGIPPKKARCKFPNEQIPKLSLESIKLLVDYYNKNSKMPEFVKIEELIDIEKGGIERLSKEEPFKSHPEDLPNCVFIKTIKLNSQNQVDIVILEEKTYSKKEVITLINKSHYDRTASGGLLYMPGKGIDSKWFDENL